MKDDEEIAGTLTIGAQESQCTYRLPSILKRFKAQFPQIKLIFKPAHSNKDAKEQLMEGKVDLAFILDECKTEDALHVEPLMKEELKVVVCSRASFTPANFCFDKRFRDGNTFINRTRVLISDFI